MYWNSKGGILFRTESRHQKLGIFISPKIVSEPFARTLSRQYARTDESRPGCFLCKLSSSSKFQCAHVGNDSMLEVGWIYVH